MAAHRSGIQRQVLSLYRDFLRQVRHKIKDPKCALQSQHRAMVQRNLREKFEQNRSIKRNQFQKIDFLLRQGRKQLQLFQSPHVTGFSANVTVSQNAEKSEPRDAP